MKSRGRWWLAVAILAAGALPPSPGEADAHAYVRPGWRHTCAQLGSDQIVCWGGNNSGQLGNGSYADSSAPTTVATLHGVVDADASVEHTCAVTGDGAAWCWGSNEWGHLGDGTTQPRAAPARMRDMHGGFLSGVTEVSLGYYHTCMRAEGGVWCAGRNELGQLGHGAATDAPEPYASPVPGVNDAIEISAGFDHACAVRNDGTVWCWGRNDHGQLGFSTTTLCVLGTQRIPCALSPGQVSGLTDIVHVDAGASHTCALRRDGAVFCWGDGSSGQLGRLPDRGGVTPVAVLTDATSVRAGARHSCAILRDGIV
ncbi:MAG TPA: hypothetical protein VM600_08230, partial [Actinomycetota bacterium]|nr:hypothetical protein [Actinomycetota bacterium]